MNDAIFHVKGGVKAAVQGNPAPRGRRDDLVIDHQGAEVSSASRLRRLFWGPLKGWFSVKLDG